MFALLGRGKLRPPRAIFLTSLKIISEKYFHGTLARQRGGGSGAIGSDVRAYRQQEEKIRVGDPGLVAEAHFAEGWLEGDQSCILRTGPGALSSRPGRHTYGQRKCAVLPIVCGKTTIKAGSLPPFRCRLSCHASCRDVVLSRKRKAETPPPHMVSRPCGAILLIAVSGLPVLVPANLHQPFPCLVRGHWGKRGGARNHTVWRRPASGPRQAGRWRCPGQQAVMRRISPSSGVYQLSHVCDR